MGNLKGLVAACLMGGLAACGPSDTAPAEDTPSIATGVGPSSSLSEKTADDLARKYIQCVNAAGFKIEHVWVHGLPETGIMVKTAVDVPAPVHGPCFKSIGGPNTDRSSWSL